MHSFLPTSMYFSIASHILKPECGCGFCTWNNLNFWSEYQNWGGPNTPGSFLVLMALWEAYALCSNCEQNMTFLFVFRLSGSSVHVSVYRGLFHIQEKEVKRYFCVYVHTHSILQGGSIPWEERQDSEPLYKNVFYTFENLFDLILYIYLIYWEFYAYNLCLLPMWKGLCKKDWEVERKLSAPYSQALS